RFLAFSDYDVGILEFAGYAWPVFWGWLIAMIGFYFLWNPDWSSNVAEALFTAQQADPKIWNPFSEDSDLSEEYITGEREQKEQRHVEFEHKFQVQKEKEGKQRQAAIQKRLQRDKEEHVKGNVQAVFDLEGDE
ncbi:MAG: hypothetical protein FWC81_03975, partial [Coriobacteriia bacterium]|nr:hypothetical protein [Coriobacteriia bacterium]